MSVRLYVLECQATVCWKVGKLFSHKGEPQKGYKKS